MTDNVQAPDSSPKPSHQQADTTIAARFQRVQARIGAAAGAAHAAERSPVTLLGAAKAQSGAAVCAAVDAGLRHIGENYLDDGLRHQKALAQHPRSANVIWHFIGPIQSNKTRDIAERFDWVQSLDRDKIARRLNDQRPAEQPPLNVLIQVNISGEDSKSGIATDAVDAFARTLPDYPRLTLRGLMAIPAPDDTGAHQRMAELFESLQATAPGIDTLSLGMSGDLERAISAGSTMVRVGSDLFGARD